MKDRRSFLYVDSLLKIFAMARAGPRPKPGARNVAVLDFHMDVRCSLLRSAWARSWKQNPELETGPGLSDAGGSHLYC